MSEKLEYFDIPTFLRKQADMNHDLPAEIPSVKDIKEMTDKPIVHQEVATAAPSSAEYPADKITHALNYLSQCRFDLEMLASEMISRGQSPIDTPSDLPQSSSIAQMIEITPKHIDEEVKKFHGIMSQIRSNFL